jgi:hypothetical protein
MRGPLSTARGRATGGRTSEPIRAGRGRVATPSPSPSPAGDRRSAARGQRS